MGGDAGAGCVSGGRVRVAALRWAVIVVVLGGAVAGCSGSGPARARATFEKGVSAERQNTSANERVA